MGPSPLLTGAGADTNVCSKAASPISCVQPNPFHLKKEFRGQMILMFHQIRCHAAT
ncbi:MAG: hypothetical protein R2765_12815 [Ferruginibacter sp.]